MWRTYMQMDPRFQRVQGRVTRYPGWVWQLSLLVAMPFLVLTGVFAVLLLVAALVAGGFVFLVLSTVFNLFSALAGGGSSGGRGGDARPQADQRENVRVINPNE